ncbi:hypothetical protein KH5H1_22900 [Corallococcus caeni]|uniref:Heme NO-binding domain-containing protein n=2 Tax=Corallococcus TaxID=83461 RepID=A0A7Y4JV18_9BACT|nr:hypothetical protein [Corallococcus exercitus]NOK11689.1 hypothetical protein [Corallococcus exercitus]GMT98171.1 hypothetical protein KH5H1_22900 [Corallococcus sp. KH5-1]GMU07021.1 hypothetical protein ASNO1_32740 [Corallococcus sp. NO1]
MDVKGVAFLARQTMMVQAFGEPAWKAFVAEQAKRDPIFGQLIMPVSRIPADAFLRFNEAMTQRFYGGDTKAYWQYGIKSAEYALSQGQLKTMFGKDDFRRFALFTPGIWKGYFTEGDLTAQLQGDTVELRITGVPRPHVYFELAVMGFAAGGLAYLSGRKEIHHEVLKGFSKGDLEVLYRFTLPTAAP